MSASLAIQVLTKIEEAHQILKVAFAHADRVAIREVVEQAAERGVSRRTLRRAATEIGVREIHNGPYGAFWEKP